jgi:hypothetical protein
MNSRNRNRSSLGAVSQSLALTMPPAPSPIVAAIAQGIGRMEGTGVKNNNPGNLRSWGSNPVVGGFAQFPSIEAGWKALYSQIQRNIERGLTLEEFFGGKSGVYAGYAPAADRNDPNRYASLVSSWSGIPLATKLNNLDPNQPYQLALGNPVNTPANTPTNKPVPAPTETAQNESGNQPYPYPYEPSIDATQASPEASFTGSEDGFANTDTTTTVLIAVVVAAALWYAYQ